MSSIVTEMQEMANLGTSSIDESAEGRPLGADEATPTFTATVVTNLSDTEESDDMPVPAADKVRGTQRTASGRSSSDPAIIVHSTEKKGLLSPKHKTTASGSYSFKSTWKRAQQAWLDPWEAKVQKDTFAANDLNTLRPHFAGTVRHEALANMDASFFEAAPIDEEGAGDELDADDAELELHETKPVIVNTLGTWDGVFANCLLNIFGVIMFLRVGWVVGQAGVWGAIGIMCISTVVTTLTALSMSAIATNGTVKAGGAYYLISRSLGPSIGGSVGLLFAIGNMVAVSMYLIGFAETLVANIGGGDSIMTGNVINDVRLVSVVMLFLVLALALGGLKYVMKVQLLLLGFICISIACLFIGSFYRTLNKNMSEDLIDLFDNCLDTVELTGSGKAKLLYGVSGWSNGNLKDNMKSYYAETAGVKYSFFTTLSVFFPAVTGIMAGANISGDLENPSVNIPVGTLWAIVITSIVYMVLAVFVGAVTSRCALLNDYLVMAQITVWPYLVLAGIYCATASSAIASLVGAPRILQKVAEDKLFGELLNKFAVLDSEGNPLNGYYLSFFVALCCCGIGQLNFVAPLITTFFMLAYTLINFACFSLETSKTPGWRPAFKFFNKYTAIAGAIACLVIMFLMQWVYALGGCMIAALLYFYIRYVDPQVNWGSADESRDYYEAYRALLKLKSFRKHVKNWRPGFLVLTKDPLRRPHLIMFAQTLKKAYGPLIYATIRTGDYRETDMSNFKEQHHRGYLPAHKIPKKIEGFYESVLADSFRNGNQMLLQLCGLGGIRPNTLVMGFSHSWKKEDAKHSHKIGEYVNIVKDTLNMGFGMMILFNFRSINWLQDVYVPPPTMFEESDGLFEDEEHVTTRDKPPAFDRTKTQLKTELGVQQMWGLGQGSEPIVDVWWLVNTGGLLPLVPHILKLHGFWHKCILRINVVVDDNDISTELKDTEELVEKFRLNYSEVRPVDLVSEEPKPRTLKYFEKLAKCSVDSMSRPAVVKRWIRVSELMMEHCRYSGLVVCSLPAPFPNDSAVSYMALLEVLARPQRMPPMILMRGSNQSSLTWMSE